MSGWIGTVYRIPVYLRLMETVKSYNDIVEKFGDEVIIFISPFLMKP